MKKKLIPLLICIIIFFGFNLLLKQHNEWLKQILYVEEKVVKISLNDQNSFGLPLTVIYHYFENIYNNKQEIQDRKANISMEQLLERIDSNELIEARHATFHNIRDCNNIKYLSRSGAYEYIVKIEKDENGEYTFIKIIDDPTNKGTYNFYNQEGNIWQRKFHHVDVVFWIIFGTGHHDNSKIYERLEFYFTKSTFCKVKEVVE